MPPINQFSGLLILLIVTLTASHSAANEPAQYDQTLVSIRVDDTPVIDGSANDPVWSRVTPLVTHDSVADIDISIKSVYNHDRIWMLVTFPDEQENRSHKTMVWAPDEGRYRTGADREDTFVFKWSLEPRPVDLRVTAEHPYKADVWYWKANRTDHAGYADDKVQNYSAMETPGSYMVISRLGNRFFLSREGDSGKPAYQTRVYETRGADRLPKYHQVIPEGSRADVRAKGVWRDGIWTIEFERRLTTSNPDDVQLDPKRTYQFGVSRYEIAARRKDPTIEEPLFGSGEIGESLGLAFN